jgi:NADH-quinone oxidoreductase subunit G
MTDDLVNLTIDGMEIRVPRGTLLVDAAKKVGIEIPVFCYHPKLEPVGMCRMCLVEIGRPSRDRSTGELLLDEDKNPIIRFGPNLETACTTRVDDGWVVNVSSEKAMDGQKDIVEFLLTSHPLDCPICDKGGECPLQELTMLHGPGKSKFRHDDKMHLLKHVPLGDLIFLDRERCIQCARCIRFQEEIVDDPVIEFSNRGRQLEIVTFSDPGFDSYFSGNSTDICPVGALTTADFRFGARPWELNAAASICPQCPVGCNIVLNTRREVKAGGGESVKRVMPRQNGMINDIWICDKGRFAYTYALDPERISKPLIKVNGELQETTWEKAIDRAVDGLNSAGSNVTGIVGGRASNEDFYNFKKLIEQLEGKSFLDDFMAGGDLVRKYGLGKGSNLSDLGQGDAILVVASDIHEEAPIWWLRIKQAQERGAQLLVANVRKTKLDKYANLTLRYTPGSATGHILGIIHAAVNEKALRKYNNSPEQKSAGEIVREAENLVIFYGSEGMDQKNSDQLSKACVSLLGATNHIGRPNNGLVPVWRQNNTQGAWDLGFAPPDEGIPESVKGSSALYIMAADPFGDHPALPNVVTENVFIVVQELFRTATVENADVVFPAQSFIERDGTFTSGERMLQRFSTAVDAFGESLPDWKILALVGKGLELEFDSTSAASVLQRITTELEDYGGIEFRDLLATQPQWPHVGGDDFYFGGTAYKNDQGLGVRLPSVDHDEGVASIWEEPIGEMTPGIFLVPVTRLFDQGTTVTPSDLLMKRAQPVILQLGAKEAERLSLNGSTKLTIKWDGHVEELPVVVNDEIPEGIVLIPRGHGFAVHTPTPCELQPAN